MAKIIVKHVGTKDGWEKPKDGSPSWIAYWEKYSGYKKQDFCRDCGKKVTDKDDPLVGAHVKKVDTNDDSIYIVPTHKSRNTRGATDKHEFECEEAILVPANKNNL